MPTPYLLTEPQWRAAFESAITLYESLKDCAELPLDSDTEDADRLLSEWLTLMQTLKVDALQDDPSFAEPLLEELALMNTELRDLFTQRKEALQLALNQQKKTTAGIEAYQQER